MSQAAYRRTESRNEHQTTVTAKSTDLPVTLLEAKSHLNLLDGDDDVAVQGLLEAAVEICETDCGRSLRVSQSITQSYDRWPCDAVRFDRQPVTAIASVKYRDGDDVEQTLASTNYRLLVSSEAGSLLEFDEGFSAPTLNCRADAVVIAYTAGYATVAAVPARAKAAILLKLAELFGNLEGREADANNRAYTDIVNGLGWGCYR